MAWVASCRKCCNVCYAIALQVAAGKVEPVSTFCKAGSCNLQFKKLRCNVILLSHACHIAIYFRVTVKATENSGIVIKNCVAR